MTGYQLRKIRLSLGETQSQFAKRLGLKHYQRVQEMEYRRNKKIPLITELKIKLMILNGQLDKK